MNATILRDVAGTILGPKYDYADRTTKAIEHCRLENERCNGVPADDVPPESWCIVGDLVQIPAGAFPGAHVANGRIGIVTKIPDAQYGGRLVLSLECGPDIDQLFCLSVAVEPQLFDCKFKRLNTFAQVGSTILPRRRTTDLAVRSVDLGCDNEIVYWTDNGRSYAESEIQAVTTPGDAPRCYLW